MYGRFLLCFAIAGGLGACSSAKEQGASARPTGGACAPGAEIACACPAGVGVQVCREDGSGYGACMFCAADAGSEAGDPGFIGNPDDLLTRGCKAIDPEERPAVVAIVVDGSGSMASASKWGAARDAATAFADALAARKDASLRVGLVVFGDDKDPTSGSGPYPSSADVEVGALDAARVRAMRDRVTLTQPGGGTPMSAALDGAYAALDAAATSGGADAKRIAVLFTDGTVASDADEAAVVQTVTGAAGRGLTTITTGIGPLADPNEYDAPFVGAVAKAGGATNAPCNPAETSDVTKLCQTHLTPGVSVARDAAASLDRALGRARRELEACVFAAPPGATADALNLVLVGADGKRSVVRQSGPNGWRLADDGGASRVVVQGSTCEALKNDRRAGVSFLLACPTAR
jgi:hypothetical protein